MTRFLIVFGCKKAWKKIHARLLHSLIYYTSDTLARCLSFPAIQIKVLLINLEKSEKEFSAIRYKFFEFSNKLCTIHETGLLTTVRNYQRSSLAFLSLASGPITERTSQLCASNAGTANQLARSIV